MRGAMLYGPRDVRFEERDDAASPVGGYEHKDTAFA